jgi:hypothetical protein
MRNGPSSLNYWGRHSNAPSQGGDHDWRQYQRSKRLPVPNRRFTLAGLFCLVGGAASKGSKRPLIARYAGNLGAIRVTCSHAMPV